MKQFSYTISDLRELSHVIDDVNHMARPGLLCISIYTPWESTEAIGELVGRLGEAFPSAVITGMTNVASIANGVNVPHRTVLLFDVFEEASVHTLTYTVSQGHEREVGIACLRDLAKFTDIAGIEILASQDEKGFTDFQPFLACLDGLSPHIPIWGAIADSESWPTGTYVFAKDFLCRSGYVVKVYTGAVSIWTDHVFGFQPLSRALEVTAMDGPMVIKELDHKPAVYFYDQYIHVKDFLEQSLPFPLIHRNHGETHAHLPQGRTADGGLIFNISTKVGARLQVSYGDPETMLEETSALLEKLMDFEPQCLHIMSCIARYLFLQKNLDDVITNYHALAPANGTYGHGEIYRSGTKLIAAHLTGCVTAFREGKRTGRPRPALLPVHLSLDMQHLLQLASFIRTAMRELTATQDALYLAATHDSLTGLLNRGALEKQLMHNLQEAKAHSTPLSAIMIDLDEFKDINDTHGHAAGDRAICRMADILKKHTSLQGAACRWGGDEFVVILPGATMQSAIEIALAMKKDLTHTCRSPGAIPMTASFGITTSRMEEDTPSFLKRIDNALYISKGRGRNRITTIDTAGVIEAVRDR